jgi:SAM-dependent methyltransferase
MPRFSDFDARGYPTVSVAAGYGEWVGTYERTVEDAMDVQLLEALTAVPWARIRRAADLGCGTGRTGRWLRGRGVASIDGVDITPEMLALAERTVVYDRLVLGNVWATGLEAEAYDLVTTCLVDEHLAELEPLYREAARLARPGGFHVLVGYHPQFIMAAGMPTHYHRSSGEAVAIETHLHLLSDHVGAGLDASWTLVEMRERLVDDEWVALKPGWAVYRGQPISFVMAWRRGREDA